jgi:hypothetical protein
LQPAVVQSGLNGNGNSGSASSPSTGGAHCDSGDSSGYRSGYSSSYGPGGFPVYPGPDAPLPPQGTYYANPYGYYNNNNPYNPYGYSQNTGYYDTGYYSGGYYNNGLNNNGYYNSGPGFVAPNSGVNGGFAPYQGYDTGARRR